MSKAVITLLLVALLASLLVNTSLLLTSRELRRELHRLEQADADLKASDARLKAATAKLTASCDLLAEALKEANAKLGNQPRQH